MNHFKRIYTSQAEAYHRMIAVEDADNLLLPAIRSIIPLENARVLDVGTGTGRFPLLLHGHAAQVIGLDLHEHMLRENTVQRRKINGRWYLVLGDLRNLPFLPARFDLVIAGWAMGHFCGWYPDRWKQEIDSGLDAMCEMCASGGAILICETLSTGSLTPAPPTESLAAYYQHLETKHGFKRQEIRTDYLFSSVEEAVRLTEFFFGTDLSMTIRNNNWSRLPEWTGLWHKTLD